MKKILFIIITLTLLIGCKSSKKQLEKGNYDAALEKAAKQIKKNPGKFEEVDTFNDAYRIAYSKDNAEVNQLIKSGNPSVWSKVYTIYLRMNKRQELAASLPPVGINYEERNFSEDINSAKNKATEYAYAKGVELLGMDNRFEVRKAYSRFQEVKRYNSNYKDVDQKLREAKELGTTNIFFTIEDNAEIVAPAAMMNQLQSININDLDRNWSNYDTYVDSTKDYHYSIILSMELIEVSPEGLKETVTVEKREVEDGFDYVLDANGNVKKDSLGNDIKVIKYKVISCQVKRFHQTKRARISGNINYYDNEKSKKLKSEPIVADAIFEHFYTLAFGNLNALTPKTRKEIDIKPLPFPRNENMVVQAGETLKKITKDVIVKNKNYLK